MKKISLLITVVLSLVATSAFANNTTKYFRAIASTTDDAAGLVYVSAASTTDVQYADSVVADATATSTSNSDNHTFYYYAKANQGFKFAGWATAADTTGIGFAHTTAEFSENLSSSSQQQANPAVKHYYAFFEEAIEFYSSLVSATTHGQGLVSVSDTANCSVYAETMADSILNSGETEHTYYLQAKPVDNAFTRFAGWYLALNDSLLSNSANYTYKVAATSQDATTPTAYEVYAKFDTIPYYSSEVIAAAVGEGGVAVLLTNATPEAYAASDTAAHLHTTSASHRYYLRAQAADATIKFAGWYSDAECTNSLSANASYTYNVTAESLDTLAPTQFHVYAKFESILFYVSAVTVNAQGEGLVDVVLASNATADYQATSTKTQRVADNTEHTYYLRAQANDVDMVDFDGWYTDGDSLLSTQTSYTYKVTAESQDTLAPTAFTVYGKFLARNPYQFRNASFEKWNAAHTEPAPGWSGPASAVGSYVSMAGGLAPAPERVEGRTGDYAVRLTSKTANLVITSVKTNGNLTTGVMNMGATTATDPSNNNHTVVDDPAHRLIIVGQPDSLEYYSKFKKGENKDYMASAKVYLHAGVNYQDPVIASQAEFCMAMCYTPAPESEDWIRNVGAFEYYDNIGWTVDSVAQQTIYVLCDLTTNPTAGGSTKDTLIIDDIRFIYNSELATATFAGYTLAFENGAAAVDSEYDEEALALVSNARNAAIETEFDAATALLTVTVKGNDVEYNPENQHVYTIQFVPNTPTMLEDMEATVQVEKVLKNGQIYIQRGEQLFDALGRQIR